MFDKILKLLVDHINQKLRRAKTALETEEKAKDIAFLQGNIIGWRKLFDYIIDFFPDFEPDIEEEEVQRIDGLETPEIEELCAQKELLIVSAEWEGLLKKVEGNREFLKETLITTADSARDLYLAQAQQKGLTDYITLFDILDTERINRKSELNFNDGDEPTDEQTVEQIETALEELPIE